MNQMQAFFLIAIVGLAAGIYSASAQTFEPVIRSAAKQSAAAERPSTISSEVWTRARWEAARKHWARDNAKFYACSNRWQEQTSGRKYSFHDQREFLFQCMNTADATQFREPLVVARASSWTREHWQAGRVRWGAIRKNSTRAETNCSNRRAFNGSPRMTKETALLDA